MTKTRLDVIAMAHRLIEVLSVDETPTADMEAYAGDVLDGLYAEMTGQFGMSFDWTVSSVPLNAFLPLSKLLASEIAGHYGIQGERRSRAMGRMREIAFGDDREELRDLNENGTVSDEEIEAGQRAEYF